MAHVERDAKQRSEAKKKEIKRSDYLKTMGNCEYRKGNYEKALIYYNQAIDVRKDSCVLFTNRALTKINLGLMDEVVSDCDRALRLNDRSLNAVLYKAEALWGLGDTRAAEDLLETSLKTHPDQTKRIQDLDAHDSNFITLYSCVNVCGEIAIEFFQQKPVLYFWSRRQC
ncbi:hypothetical protein QTP88_023083 [Uroleucon formosanum]